MNVLLLCLYLRAVFNLLFLKPHTHTMIYIYLYANHIIYDFFLVPS